MEGSVATGDAPFASRLGERHDVDRHRRQQHAALRRGDAHDERGIAGRTAESLTLIDAVDENAANDDIDDDHDRHGHQQSHGPEQLAHQQHGHDREHRRQIHLLVHDLREHDVALEDVHADAQCEHA
jgi:hypothetical protein